MSNACLLCPDFTEHLLVIRRHARVTIRISFEIGWPRNHVLIECCNLVKASGFLNFDNPESGARFRLLSLPQLLQQRSMNVSYLGVRGNDEFSGIRVIWGVPVSPSVARAYSSARRTSATILTRSWGAAALQSQSHRCCQAPSDHSAVYVTKRTDGQRIVVSILCEFGFPASKHRQRSVRCCADQLLLIKAAAAGVSALSGYLELRAFG
ncbi:hypothetical protein BDZ88DRAFT_442339 [Geranomyces variabilis]|nr:hypothetical protein BDZ88DRAFT_442339 [Geranomyces variabilis]